MAFCELRYFSNALRRQMAANCIVPQGQPGPFPVLYLLHGLSDDHTAWARNSSIERHVAGLPLIVVMPNGGRGFYIDAHVGEQWASSITADLIPVIDATFPTRAERKGRSVGGLSMGGYGAARLALAHPELFVSANSHSGALEFGRTELTRAGGFEGEYDRILGPNRAGSSNDLFSLASKAMTLEARERPALRIDCGRDDGLFDANQKLHQHLAAIGYRHEYEEFEGGHDWAYWDTHVREAIAFHAGYLKLN